MADFWKDLIMIVGSYFGVIILLFAGLNFFSVGFLFTWLKVKLSRGKKILVIVRTVTQDYYRAGVIDKGFLIFKDKLKEERRVSLVDGCISKGIGVNNVFIDDEKNSVFVKDFSSVSGFDAVKYNDLYLRALYKPTIFDNREKILLAIVVITLVAVAVVGFLVYTNSGRIDEVISVVAKIGSIKEVV
ncbi:MAG: hypothetical protein U9O78_03035 [Patescibacteria group bacterium]|nr:hypothetical protein [Patescibacteria group bacterium]